MGYRVVLFAYFLCLARRLSKTPTCDRRTYGRTEGRTDGLRTTAYTALAYSAASRGKKNVRGVGELSSVLL